MPYAVVPPVDRASRTVLADAFWTGMHAAKPDLDAAISLQRKLIGAVEELVASLGARQLPRLSLPPKYLTTKLRAGIPALANEPIPMPYDLLGDGFARLCEALADGASGEATRLLVTAVREKQLNVPPLLLLTLRREQAAVRMAATKTGLGHDLLWLVCDLAVGPFVHAELTPLFDRVEATSPLHEALQEWERGYCPLCGSWPAFLEGLRAGAGHSAESQSADASSRSPRADARCAFCAAAWNVPTHTCVYCSASGEPIVALAPTPERPTRQVVVCRGCRGYVKVVDARPLPFPLLPLTDLDSMDLDLAAMQAGFARPALKQFGRKR